MQSQISPPHGKVFKVFNPPINYLFFSFFFFFWSLSCFVDLSQKMSEIIENIIFSLIFVLQKI